MGIPGLLNAIGSGERISLSRLAVTHLERTARPIRIAVDISIWLFQVQAGRGGKNPELRTLFYRLLKFLALPVHPLFVYDGKDKPSFKRGKAVRTYSNAPIIRHSKALIELFRFPIHDAPGEAEAECAKLQKEGVVDAVMSNDVDALMFGSSSTIMNFSKEAGSGTTSASHVTWFRMGGQTNASNVPIDRAGIILFAMLSGGDYLPAGVQKCGSKLAAEIAKAGFGEDLLDAVYSDSPELDTMLNEWRERLQYELDENESGYFQTKHKAVRIPEAFPDRTILSFYANPVVSNTQDLEELRNRLLNAWDQDIDVLEIRRFAAEYLDWNYVSGARKVVKLLAEPLVFYRLRLGKSPLAFPRGPSLSHGNEPMLQKIYKERKIFATDGLTEFQLDIVPIDVAGLDLDAEPRNPPLPSHETTVSGDEEEDQEVVETQSPVKKRVTKRFDPYALEKVWVFETLATIGIPEAVQKWKEEQAAKLAAKKKPAARKTGPRKKGPIDPGMKRGSILKYGTLTKQQSDISEFKQARLLEAATSSTPKKTSPSKTQHSQGSPSRFLGNSPIRDVYNLGPAESTGRRYTPFDDLVDVFSSSCTISPNLWIKRPPVVNRPRVSARRAATFSDGIEVEDLDLEVSSSWDCSPPPSSSGGIRMSYSNFDCQSSVIEDQAASTKDMALPSPTARERRRKASQKPIPQVSQESQVVDELEDAMLSLSLLKHNSLHETHAKSSFKPKSPKVAEKPKVVINSKKQTKKTLERSEKSDIEPKCEEKSIKTRKAKRSQPKADEGSRHIESVTASNGFWRVETETELASVESNDSDPARVSKRDQTKKKRVPRVSILDLS
ncbi:hypothetical protein ASPWEDRAFT_26017 [Aspergillus wentii DTO 134E9]|uniref:XPG-I domain-containing protein n=1 Tax=Aspergillus wentii DTO 134E9 TaxID=1073089 RepID=A0A1L9RNY6_ASPWE|nr:uncharacterized protein ASPWEDRAFT_26017 [Aspergillus wentii DTO 134E9]KAI9934304.1 hypothetical protein MW887_005378 [Aspergillus wentii]OJJ36558.1 hypothetical protein ASPWEDRAFT_26017 [Aspergillus wentii DTO 134E9]